MNPPVSVEAERPPASLAAVTALRRVAALRSGALVSAHAWLAIGAVLLAATWAYALFGFGGAGAEELFGRWVYDAVFAVAAVACLCTAMVRPDLRMASGALGLGILSFLGGSVIYSLAPDLDAVPVPSLSDPLWLAIYPLEYVALLALIRRQVGRTLLATRLDGLLGGLAVAAVMASVSIPAANEGAADAGFWERATWLAYPVADLVLLAAVVSAVGLAGWRIDRLWGTLAAAIAAWETADLIYLTVESEWLVGIGDALVLTGGLGLAAAVTFAPSRGALPKRIGNRGLFVPVGFGLLALVVLVLAPALKLTAVAVGLAGVALALALARMAIALAENRALLDASRVEATTDALTGLANRRRFEPDLAGTLAGGTPHVLVLFDLNGFKRFNDTFGHGAGDRLLARLAAALAAQVASTGTAYRMGGDEFCVLAPVPADVATFAADCAAALGEHGDGYAISAAYGAVVLPEERADASSVLALADERMYHDKHRR